LAIASPGAQWQIPQSPRAITSFCRTPAAVHENRSAMMLGFGQWGNGCGRWEKQVQSRTLLLHRRWHPHLRPHFYVLAIDWICFAPRPPYPHWRRELAASSPRAEMRPALGRRDQWGPVKGSAGATRPCGAGGALLGLWRGWRRWEPVRTHDSDRRGCGCRRRWHVGRSQGHAGGKTWQPALGKKPRLRQSRCHRRMRPDLFFRSVMIMILHFLFSFFFILYSVIAGFDRCMWAFQACVGWRGGGEKPGVGVRSPASHIES
jgi:hypothetical protein